MYVYKKENEHQILFVSEGTEQVLKHAFPYAFTIENELEIQHVPKGYCFILQNKLQKEGAI